MQADPIQVTYSTVGVLGDASLDGTPVLEWPSYLGPSGIDGTPVISFQGVSDATLTTGQPFDLGQFTVDSMPAGSTTAYNHVPFQIAFTEHAVDGAVVPSNETPIILDGFLNGTLVAGSPPQFVLNFNTYAFAPEDAPPFLTTTTPFRTGNLMNYLWVDGGIDGQMLQGVLNTEHAAAEPGSLAIFAPHDGSTRLAPAS